MYILMKYSKIEGTRAKTSSHRVGLFRTRRGANKVMQNLVRQENRKSVPATFKIEKDCYYSTREFWQSMADAYQRWQDKKYTRLMNKYTKIQRQLDEMRRARG